MFEKKKKQIKKKILSILASCIIPLLIVIIVGTGLLSVWSFIVGLGENLFSDSSGNADLSEYNLEKLLSIVDDKDILTEEMLDNMMIERESFKALLQGVHDYNTKYDTRTIEVQCKHVYTEEQPQEEKDEETNITEINPAPTANSSDSGVEAITVVTKEDYNKTIQVTVSAKDYESAYKLDWQPLYIFLVMETLSKDGNGRSAVQSSSAAETSEKPEEKEDKVSEEPAASVKEMTATSNGDSTEDVVGSYNPKTEWDDSFLEASNETGIPVGLLKALAFRESSFREEVVSSAGAVGLMQVKPSTAGKTKEELMNGSMNIMCGARYLAYLITEFNNSVILGLCAYNHGPYYKPLKDNTLTTTDLAYSARVLSTYTGQSLTGALLLSGNYDLTMEVQSGLGTYNEETGRLTVTGNEVDILIQDFCTHFEYKQDVVRDEKTFYTFEECAELPNGGLQSDGGDPGTETGEYVWYVPRSELIHAAMPYEDVYYTDGVQTSYLLNNERWITLVSYYWTSTYYDGEWLAQLISMLPNGQEVLDRYQYYAALADGTIETWAHLPTQNYYVPGGFTGYYDTDNPYEGVRLNSDGMTRNWSMTDEDVRLIQMSDMQMWEITTGIRVNTKPTSIMALQGTMEKRMVYITVPIWTWRSSAKNDYEKRSTTMTLCVNSALANTFKHIFQDIYNDESQPVIVKSATGAYCYRMISGSSSLSTHSFGVAIDINWNTNVNGYTHAKVYYKKTSRSAVPTKAQWNALPESKAKYELLYRDCPIVCIFKAYGFTWGADWNSSQDAMHFSKIGDLSQSDGLTNHTKYYK